MSRLRLTPIGLSVLVNLALIGLMTRVLVATPTQPQRYIAVELRAAPTFNIQHPTSNVQRPKPSGRQPAVSGLRPKPEVHRSLFTVHSSLPPVRSLFTVHPSDEVAGVQQSFTGGGGTTSTGTGAYAGSGAGGGITGSGGGTVTNPNPEVAPTPPSSKLDVRPDPPKPAGESRNPSVAKQTKPVYPSDAREDGVEGTSVIQAFLDADGRITGTKLEKSSGDRRLDRAAVEAVSHWTFNPCLRDGVAVKSSVRVRVEFKLE